ncbi:MAG: hypothetical protein NTV58_03845 [Deltaproteobacteria bacterium]|nr:hypothetical protein [Deltaproteobacteria bacterium]
MAQVNMEIVEPYERRGNDVIVYINKTIIEAGMPPKSESLYLHLKNRANESDSEIRRLAMSKIREHLEKMPEEI